MLKEKIFSAILFAVLTGTATANTIWDFAVEQKDWNNLHNDSAMREDNSLKLMVKSADSGIINNNVNVNLFKLI